MYNNMMRVFALNLKQKRTQQISLNHLGQNLIEIYPPNSPQRPVFLIAYWRDIFSYLEQTVVDRFHLRSLCHLFLDALQPQKKSIFTHVHGYTEFPHPHLNHTVDSLIDLCNTLYEDDPTTAPSILFIKEGDHEVDRLLKRVEIRYRQMEIRYPIEIIGAGRNKTTIHGGGFRIDGTKEEGKRVVLKGMTVKGSKKMGNLGFGLYCSRKGLSILCDSVTFTGCRGAGVSMWNTKGRLIIV
jgi:hypothetical protein